MRPFIPSSPLETTVASLFEDRPIWSSFAIYNQFDSDERPIVRKILPKVAFYFCNGPWRNCWVKIGIDPKSSKVYAKYQILELRSFFLGPDKHNNSDPRSHILSLETNASALC